MRRIDHGLVCSQLCLRCISLFVRRRLDGVSGTKISASTNVPCWRSRVGLQADVGHGSSRYSTMNVIHDCTTCTKIVPGQSCTWYCSTVMYINFVPSWRCRSPSPRKFVDSWPYNYKHGQGGLFSRNCGFGETGSKLCCTRSSAAVCSISHMVAVCHVLELVIQPEGRQFAPSAIDCYHTHTDSDTHTFLALPFSGLTGTAVCTVLPLTTVNLSR